MTSTSETQSPFFHGLQSVDSGAVHFAWLDEFSGSWNTIPQNTYQTREK